MSVLPTSLPPALDGQPTAEGAEPAAEDAAVAAAEAIAAQAALDIAAEAAGTAQAMVRSATAAAAKADARAHLTASTAADVAARAAADITAEAASTAQAAVVAATAAAGKAVLARRRAAAVDDVAGTAAQLAAEAGATAEAIVRAATAAAAEALVRAERTAQAVADVSAQVAAELQAEAAATARAMIVAATAAAAETIAVAAATAAAAAWPDQAEPVPSPTALTPLVGRVGDGGPELLRTEHASQLADPVLPRFAVPVQVGVVVSAASPGERGLWRDLSLAGRMRAGLRASEAHFEGAFDGAPTALLVAALPDGGPIRFLHVNQALCRLTGRSALQLLGCGFADLAHPQQEPLDERDLAGPGPHAQLQRVQRWLRPGGGELWVRLHLAVLPGAEPSDRRVVCHVEDLAPYG